MPIEILTGYAAFFAGMPVLYAFGRIVWVAREAPKALSIAVFLFIGCYGWRALWWALSLHTDIANLYPFLWGTLLPTFWNGAFVVGCYYALRAIHGMVPDEDRQKWPVIIAWLYPPVRLRRRKSG